MKMKAILEFDLDDYEDRLAHIRACKATNAYQVLWDLQEIFRSIQKYESYEGEKIRYTDEFDKVRSLFYNLLEQQHINLEEEII